MEKAVIVPRFVNSPKPGKKNWSLKISDDDFYMAPPALGPKFKAGGTYEVEYEESEFNGNIYKNIKKMVEKAAPAAHAGGGKYGVTDDATAERIYCCGALNAFIQAGKIEPNVVAVTKATECLRQSWANTFGKKDSAPKPQRTKEENQEEYGDEIPFN